MADNFPVTRRNGKAYVEMPSALVVRNRQELKEKILEGELKDDRVIVLDCSSCGYIASSGLGVLNTLTKKLNVEGREVWIDGLNKDLTELMELTKLDMTLRLGNPDTATAV